jgi:hypothetical protein
MIDGKPKDPRFESIDPMVGDLVQATYGLDGTTYTGVIQIRRARLKPWKLVGAERSCFKNGEISKRGDKWVGTSQKGEFEILPNGKSRELLTPID